MNMVLRFTTCLMPSRTRTKTSKNKLGFWRWTLHIHICHQIFTVLLIYSCILKSTFIRSSTGQHSVRGGRLQPADRSQRKEGARSSVSLGRGGGGEPRAQRLPQTEDHADVSSFHMRWIGGKTVSNCHLFFLPNFLSLFHRTHMQDLQEVTQDLHYENFRSDRLKRGGRLSSHGYVLPLSPAYVLVCQLAFCTSPLSPKQQKLWKRHYEFWKAQHKYSISGHSILSHESYINECDSGL